MKPILRFAAASLAAWLLLVPAISTGAESGAVTADRLRYPAIGGGEGALLPDMPCVTAETLPYMPAPDTGKNPETALPFFDAEGLLPEGNLPEGVLPEDGRFSPDWITPYTEEGFGTAKPPSARVILLDAGE